MQSCRRYLCFCSSSSHVFFDPRFAPTPIHTRVYICTSVRLLNPERRSCRSVNQVREGTYKVTSTYFEDSYKNIYYTTSRREMIEREYYSFILPRFREEAVWYRTTYQRYNDETARCSSGHFPPRFRLGSLEPTYDRCLRLILLLEQRNVHVSRSVRNLNNVPLFRGLTL